MPLSCAHVHLCLKQVCATYLLDMPLRKCSLSGRVSTIKFPKKQGGKGLAGVCRSIGTGSANAFSAALANYSLCPGKQSWLLPAHDELCARQQRDSPLRGSIAITGMQDCRHWLRSYLELSQSHFIGKQATMKSKQRSGKRLERNFEIVVNHININGDQLPQVSQQSVAALKDVFGQNIKKYSGTFHHKPDNDHIHILVMSEAPKTESAVKAGIATSMAPIFGTQTGLVEVKLFNELKADAGPAQGLKGLGDYRSLYVNNNDHPNHRPKDPEHRTVEFMCIGDWDISHGGARRGAGRQGAGRQGPIQVATAAIKAGTPELQCKTYEEFERLLASTCECRSANNQRLAQPLCLRLPSSLKSLLYLLQSCCSELTFLVAGRR